MRVELEPIGEFHCVAEHPYDAARQAVLGANQTGRVELYPGHNYDQALADLDGFSHIWLIYLFHHNPNWKPMVLPPRANRKHGVFATRAPYRPNPIGISCVELLDVSGRGIQVGAHDLLDGTPILDIKPYISYADSFPDATCGWLDELQEEQWAISYTDTARQQVSWLEHNGLNCLHAFVSQQLSENPTDRGRKRVKPCANHHWEIAYRTWRVRFRADEATRAITVCTVKSGYTARELESGDDPYADKSLHKRFTRTFHGKVRRS